MKKLKLTLSLLLVVVAGLFTIQAARADTPPPLPSSFFGTVKIHGANVPTGTMVTAVINGTQYAYTSTVMSGGNSVYSLDVPGDNPTTPAVVEGGVQNNTIVFKIEGVVAEQTGAWSYGTNVNLALTISNHAPVITEGATTSVTISKNGTPKAFALTLHATDLDAGDTLTWSIATPAAHGTASATGDGKTKAIGYTPTSNYVGADGFVVQVADGKGGVDTFTVNVTVQAPLMIYLPVVTRSE